MGIFGGCMRNSMFNVTYKRHQNVKILAFGTFHSLAKLSVDICARVYVRACKCVRENVCVCMWKIHELSNAKAQRHIFALQLTCRLAHTHTYVDSNQQPKPKGMWWKFYAFYHIYRIVMNDNNNDDDGKVNALDSMLLFLFKNPIFKTYRSQNRTKARHHEIASSSSHERVWIPYIHQYITYIGLRYLGEWTRKSHHQVHR